MSLRGRFLITFIRRRLLTLPSRPLAMARYSSQDSSQDSYHSKFAVQEIELLTCSQELHCMQTVIGVADLPRAGLRLNVKYIDTNPSASEKTPVVVALHGTPGSHKDFSAVTDILASRGVRVITPNYPGYGWTDVDTDKVFKHTTREKSVFVLEFLAALQINRVDLLLAHSGGAYPAAQLCIAAPSVFKGLALINPGGHKLMKTLSGYTWLRMHLYAKLVRWRIIRPLALAFLGYKMRRINYPIQDVSAMSTAIETIVQADFEEFGQQAASLSISSFPMSVVFSKDDRMVSEKTSRELSQLLGCAEDALIVHNSMGEPIAPSSQLQPSYIDGHVFETGGHFVMIKHPNATSDILFDLLGRVRQKQGFTDLPSS